MSRHDREIFPNWTHFWQNCKRTVCLIPRLDEAFPEFDEWVVHRCRNVWWGTEVQRSRCVIRTDELFFLYWAGEMFPTHSRRDFRLWNQGRSCWICSFRAALTKEVDGIAIALLKYILIHSFRQLKVSGYFPVSPQAAEFADLLFIPRRYFRWRGRSWTYSKGCLAMAVMSIFPSCMNLFTNFFMIGDVGSQIWHLHP
jgi:hypothetical protein